MSEGEGLSGRISGDRHELLQRVYFEDTDFSGLVYHARYLHFMERGRSDFLRLLGIHHRSLMADGQAFAVRRMTIEFIKPAIIDDVLRIVTRTARLGGARIELQQAIYRQQDVLVEAGVTVALVGSDQRPARLPAAVKLAFDPVLRLARAD